MAAHGGLLLLATLVLRRGLRHGCLLRQGLRSARCLLWLLTSALRHRGVGRAWVLLLLLRYLIL